VIENFRDQRTAALFKGIFVKGVPDDVRRRAKTKLLMIDAAVELVDLLSPPGNMLEALQGKEKGLHSIRVNDQWRIVFRWSGGRAVDVCFMDYH
jgi:proteic killer suppression protein